MWEPVVRPGHVPLILVAPHGGARDVSARPWHLGSLRVNDLHTADFTRALAEATGAAAVINEGLDRNAIDLNRITAAHENAPAFLAAIADMVEAALHRHGRATVLMIHGWNVVEPAVDVGLGAAAPPGAVSDAFAAGPLEALLHACADAGIAATVGARYPARGRENLVQLFTARHLADPRPLVQRLVTLRDQVDAMQVELSIPLRLPGPWRQRMLGALVRLAPHLAGSGRGGAPPPLRPVSAPGVPTRHRIEFSSPDLCGVLHLNREGTRMLLLPRGGNLLLFTAETARGNARRVLEWSTDASGALHVTHHGPLLAFPDDTPFVALELGLVRATVVDAELRFEFTPAGPGATVQVVQATARVGTHRVEVSGSAFVRPPRPTTIPHYLELAVALGADRGLVLHVPQPGACPLAEIATPAGNIPLEGVRLLPLGRDHPFERFTISGRSIDGGTLEVTAAVTRRVPLTRATADGSLVHAVLATVSLAENGGEAGWMSGLVPLRVPLPPSDGRVGR